MIRDSDRDEEETVDLPAPAPTSAKIDVQLRENGQVAIIAPNMPEVRIRPAPGPDPIREAIRMILEAIKTLGPIQIIGQ